MRKGDIVMQITKNLRDVHGKRFAKDDVNAIVTYVFDSIMMSLRVRDKVIIRGFGRFEVRRRQVRKYYDMRKQKEALSGERLYIKFSQSVRTDLDRLY